MRETREFPLQMCRSFLKEQKNEKTFFRSTKYLVQHFSSCLDSNKVGSEKLCARTKQEKQTRDLIKIL